MCNEYYMNTQKVHFQLIPRQRALLAAFLLLANIAPDGASGTHAFTGVHTNILFITCAGVSEVEQYTHLHTCLHILHLAPAREVTWSRFIRKHCSFFSSFFLIGDLCTSCWLVYNLLSRSWRVYSPESALPKEQSASQSELALLGGHQSHGDLHTRAGGRRGFSPDLPRVATG